MAIILDSTKSGEFANSYVTVADADDYLSNHYNSTYSTTWDALSQEQKEVLLIQATAIIDTFRFTEPVSRDNLELHYSRVTGMVSYYTTRESPVRYNVYQNLQFPRSIDINSTTSVTYIPEAVKLAVFEQAISLKNFSANSTANTDIMQGIKRKMVEIANQITKDVTYQDSAGGITETSLFTSSLSPIAYQLLAPYLIRGSRTKRA